MFEILSFSQLQRGWMNSMLRLSEIMVPSEFVYNPLVTNSTLNFRIIEIAAWTEGSYG